MTFFRTTINGFRVQIDENFNELENYMSYQGESIIKSIYRKYFRHKGVGDKVQFVPDSVKTQIENDYRKRPLDRQMFDEAYKHATTYLRPCYNNFFKSDIFLNYIQSQEIEQVEKPAVPSKPKFENRQVVRQQVLEPKPEPVAEPVAKPVAKPVEEKPVPKDTSTPLKAEPLGKIHINEYDGLRHLQERLPLKPFIPKASNLNYIPEHDQTRSNTSTLNRMKMKNSSEIVQKDFGLIDEMPRNFNPASVPSMPYRARGSTVNPVTRQGSAFHSMATDTSDAYSSFSEDPIRSEKKQYRNDRKVIKGT